MFQCAFVLPVGRIRQTFSFDDTMIFEQSRECGVLVLLGLVVHSEVFHRKFESFLMDFAYSLLYILRSSFDDEVCLFVCRRSPDRPLHIFVPILCDDTNIRWNFVSLSCNRNPAIQWCHVFSASSLSQPKENTEGLFLLVHDFQIFRFIAQE